MQDNLNTFGAAAAQPVEARSQFIWKCYAHVAGAIVAFAAIEAYLISSGVAQRIAGPMINNWLMVLGAFILVSWGASHVAHRLESTASQYAAFAVFIVAESLIFAPILLAAMMMQPGMIESAAAVTLLGTAGLVATAMITRKDFSFLRGLLVWGGMLVLVGIVGSILFGAHLGTWFSVGMIGFAGAAVLYDTSNIMHHYPTDKYVAASMALFASIALMFWYVLRLFMSRD
ncbi:MAG: Bax inhibitor-1 family protein [Gammaproteobacteria bacterium]|nr:Bax inhibitor-1 family protein [Gammaproteobacteria bacterium]MBT8104629.1 Bax inhibitor-1 family protein [Gammaproteobacteria bacterium]NNF49018.1 permease [Woeseiaceae bacterium]NNK24643.1 permease [Woeseiaceae bacterium]NNL62509.1 permease [Woeseiaceae bacterium]